MSLQEIIKKIKKQGAHRGYEFISEKTLGRNTFVIANKKTEKAILVGKDADSKIKCYSVNINKWMWAENEGFSTDEIVDKLFNEIFKKIKIKNPVSNAQVAQMSKMLM
ncbi:hypothetical protein CMI37_33720 [Candidatus Pacearchaeota archaeon]|nr:hypothetical protein [Candidatus Pacearchaeota archaeon]|tara:strand:- start:735 stop:1058 length:324 start_codon:yes stop_codon:yes gene_type:complete